ncbi:PAAR domain-containing protein [Paraburkholderia elongata]|uniref:PAAR domain-containing protein n=1 Tax=Paraburkholderia elongata TaxID=2675747 RepID=A0A972SKD4_9BURK|nr:PAAR domain-containing protein [Paraburkholderia elongata]NPT57942.1 PAAR domain-containing protein [Paraburkholderia elongata]
MRKAAVRDGDPTTTGGRVMGSSTGYTDHGKKLALDGDVATCNNCKGIHRIFGTGKGISDKGRNVVVDGDSVLCPCGKNRVIVGSNPGYFLNSDHGSAGPSSASKVSPANESAVLQAYDRHFQLLDQDGSPIAGALVHVQNPAGEIQEVTTTPEGKTPTVEGRDGGSARSNLKCNTFLV